MPPARLSPLGRSDLRDRNASQQLSRVRGDSQPAVVVTDLDGTLLLSDGSVSERAVAALRAVAAQGTRVVFATASPAWSARGLLSAAASCWAPSWCRRTAPWSATWTAGAYDGSGR